MSKDALRTRKKNKEAKEIARSKKNAGYRIVADIELPPGAIIANWESLQHNHATIPELSYPKFYSEGDYP